MPSSPFPEEGQLCCCGALHRGLGKRPGYQVLLPKGQQFDIDVSRSLVSHLGIRSYEINIADCFDALMGQLSSSLPEIAVQTVTNLPPRLRMAATYAVSSHVTAG